MSEQLKHMSEPNKRISNAEANPLMQSERKRSRYPKTDLRYWRESIRKPIYTRGNEKFQAPNFAAFFQHRGRRTCLSLGTPNKEAAATHARNIYQYLQANGWPATLQKYRPSMAPKKSDVTIGDFIKAVQATADISAPTLQGYCRAFRRIVADISGVKATDARFDYRKGGHAEWIAKVSAVKLSKITPAKVQEWKKAFLAKGDKDPMSQRRAKVTVNSFLRQARSLFSAKNVLPHIADRIELADPLPFSSINFEEEPSLKYKRTFDVRDLIQRAEVELAVSQPELFKIFLLAVMAGLRRKEIDLLEWASFRWPENVIRIETTEFFKAKTEESNDDVEVDRELMEIFRGFRAKATGDFVIESRRKPKAGVSYQYYRCQEQFDALIEWLHRKGVKGNKPLHTLRKEFGSEICAVHGIHAASRALRHADISVTNEYYTDSRARITVGMGHLLKQSPENVTVLSSTAPPTNEPHENRPAKTDSSAFA
jgi:integrase